MDKKNYLLRKAFRAIREEKKDIEVPDIPLSYDLSWLRKFVLDSVSDLIEEEDKDEYESEVEDEDESEADSGSDSDFDAMVETRDDDNFGFGSPVLCKICGQTHKPMKDPAGVRKAIYSSLKKEGKEDKEAAKVAETAEMAHLNEDNDPPEKSSEEVKSEDTCRHCKKQLGPRSFRTIISNKGNIEHIGFCVDCFETGELK